MSIIKKGKKGKNIKGKKRNANPSALKWAQKSSEHFHQVVILHNTALNKEKLSNTDTRQCVGGTVGKRERQRVASALLLLIKADHFFLNTQNLKDKIEDSQII